jgi:hypothetical protein
MNSILYRSFRLWIEPWTGWAILSASIRDGVVAGHFFLYVLLSTLYIFLSVFCFLISFIVHFLFFPSSPSVFLFCRYHCLSTARHYQCVQRMPLIYTSRHLLPSFSLIYRTIYPMLFLTVVGDHCVFIFL